MNDIDTELFTRWWAVSFMLASNLIPNGKLEICITRIAYPLEKMGQMDIYYRAEVRSFLDNTNIMNNTIVYQTNANTEYEAGVLLITKLLEASYDKGINLPDEIQKILAANNLGVALPSIAPKKSVITTAMVTETNKANKNNLN